MVRVSVIRNRRRFSRRIVRSPVLVSLNASSGLLYNLSEGGLAVDVMGAPPSELIWLTFKLPGTDKPIEASAQLAWREDAGRRTGVRFAELSETSQQRIKEWLSSPAIGLDEEEADRAQPETLIPSPVEVLAPEPEAPGTVAEVSEAASQEPAADSAASTPSPVQPKALGSRGFASWDADGLAGLEEDETIVGDLRAALFRAAGAGTREVEPSQPPPEPQQLARRQWHLNNLIFAVVCGSLVGVALGVGIVLLDEHRAQVLAGLDDIERSLAGFFTPSKKSIPGIAPARPGATRPVGERRTDVKDQPTRATGSGSAGGETSSSGVKEQR